MNDINAHNDLFDRLIHTALDGIASTSPSTRIEATMAYQDAVAQWGSVPGLRTTGNRNKLRHALYLQGYSPNQSEGYLNDIVSMYDRANSDHTASIDHSEAVPA